MRRRTRRILIALIALGVLGGIGLGVSFVLKKGQRSQNPFERGVRAERQGDFETAERLYRDLLQTKPDHPQAFARLVFVLNRQGRFDAIDEAARERCENAPQLNDGWATRVDVAMRTGRFVDAERIARSRTAEDPLLLHLTIWRIQNSSDDPRRRLAAVESALRYAQLAKVAEGRAVAELFAIRTLLSLAEGATSEVASQFREQAERLRRDGSAHLKRSTQANPSEVARLLLARFQLFDPWVTAQRDAEDDLALWLRANTAHPSAEDVRVELVEYRLRAGKGLPARADAEQPEESREAYFEAAVQLAAPLVDHPALQLFRVLRSFSYAGADAEALRLLEMRRRVAGDELVELERCRLLLKTGREPQDQVAARALDLLRATNQWRIAVMAYNIARTAGKSNEALEALEAHQRRHPAPLLAMSLAGHLLDDESRTEEAIRLVEESYGEGGSLEMLRPALQILHRAGPEHVLAFLETRIAEQPDEEIRYRLMRALYLADRLRSEENAAAEHPDWKERAKGDLERCLLLVDEAEPLHARVAAQAAIALREFGLAGGFAAKLIVRSESGLRPALGIFAAAAATRDTAARDAFLGEIEAGTRGTPDETWCAAVSEALRSGKTTRAQILDAILAASPIENANVRTLDAIAHVAASANRIDVAESAARRLLALDPAHPVGSGILGAVHLQRGEYGKVLEIHAASGVDELELAPAAHEQCIRALVALKRRPDAVKRAQRYFRANLQEQRAYTTLASALAADKQTAEALSVLTAAPQSDAILLQRAALLIELNQMESAEQLLRVLCIRRPDAVRAWEMRVRVLTAQKRIGDLLLPLTRAMELPAIQGKPPVLIALRVIRGLANENAGRVAAAIDDYVQAIEQGERGVVALNNAAWLIYRTDKPKLAKAREYIELALAASPRQPSVRDTAAHIYFALEEHSLALESITIAVEQAPGKLGYRLTHARILHALGRDEDAVRELTGLLASDPPPELEHDAEELRRKIVAAEAPD